MEGSSAIYLAINEPIGCLLVPVLGCKSAELREKEPAFTEALQTEFRGKERRKSLCSRKK